MPITPIQPLAFTIADAASYSGLARSRIYVLMQSGELPAVKIGRRRMIRRDAIDALFDQGVPAA